MLKRLLNSINVHWNKKHINLLATGYINLRCLPFREAIHFPILCYGKCKLMLTGGGKIKLDKVSRGALKIGLNTAAYRTRGTTTITLLNHSEWKLGGYVTVCQGASVVIGENASLLMGDNSQLGDGAEIICKRKIVIGKSVDLTWDCQLTDFNSHPIMDLETKKLRELYKDVTIGDYCWICNRTTIQPGTVMPDHTIVASNSLLNKNYIEMGIAPYSMIGGQPARLLAKNVMRADYA